jgi:hypothetical protein
VNNLELGPVFGVPLIQTLPLGINGGMVQAMPSRSDLVDVKQYSERVVAGYEVLLSHYVRQCGEIAELKSKIERLKDERRD